METINTEYLIAGIFFVVPFLYVFNPWLLVLIFISAFVVYGYLLNNVINEDREHSENSDRVYLIRMIMEIEKEHDSV